MSLLNGFNIFLVLVSGGFIIFARNPLLIVAGGMFLFLLAYMAQGESDEHHHYEYVLERFKAGDALECSFFRTSQTLVDPANGWKLYGDDRFIKGDQIINEAKWCSVAGKASPKPFYLWGWLTYAGIGLVFGILRFVLRDTRKEFYRVLDKADEEANSSDTDPQ